MLYRRFRIGLQLLLCVVLLLTMAVPAFADDGVDSDVDQMSAQADDSVLEVGVWYVNDYESCGGWGLGDLGVTDDDALGVRSRLIDKYWWWIFQYPTPRWQSKYTYGNTNAWEKDWKRSGAGGWENNYIDNVDLAYFAGHANKDGFFFGVGGNKKSDCQVTKNDVYNSWGTKDLDWAAIAACNVLDDPYSSYRYWARSMAGLRLFMGMKTVMSDKPYGKEFGRNIRWGKSMTYSWFRAIDKYAPNSQIARILAEHPAYYNDRWYNHHSPTVVDNYFSMWTHRAKTPIAAARIQGPSQVDIALLDGEAPVFKVQQMSLAEATTEFGSLAATFQLTDTAPITPSLMAGGVDATYQDTDELVSQDGELVMDSSLGNYQYIDSDKVWNYEETVRAANADGMMAIRADDARVIAETFLAQNDLMLPDAQFSAVTQDMLVTIEDPSRLSSGLSAASEPLRIVEEVPTNYVVSWSRVITYTPPGLSGASVNQPISFEVVGPGSKLDVFVATATPLGLSAAALTQDAVVGNAGGWAERSDTAAAGAEKQLTVPMLPIETVETLYEKLGARVVLDNVPLPATSAKVVGNTMAYYQGAIGFGQAELIPIYILKVEVTYEGNAAEIVGQNVSIGPQPMSPFVTEIVDQNVPVNPQYMSPYAEIVAPPNVAAALPGTKIELKARDASKTLAELGIDPSLNFALGTGDPDSYTYDWYIDEVADDNKVGSGRTLEYTVPNADSTTGKPASVKFVLQVTDTYSSNDTRYAEDSLMLTFGKIYLPTIQN